MAAVAMFPGFSALLSGMIFITLIAGGLQTYGQISINTDGSAPDNSSILDVKSTSKGMLVPRMTVGERNAIASPATGLLVFCTDNNQYYTNKGTPALPDWVMVSSQWLINGNNLYYTTGNVGIGTSSPAQMLQVSGSVASAYGNRSYAAYRFGDGSENTGFSSPDPNSICLLNGGAQTAIMDGSGRFGIGVVAPVATAQLEISSTSRGLLPPRMTSAQMNAIASPAEGLMVYNTSLKTMCWFNGTTWTHGQDGQSCGSVTYLGKTYQTVLIGQQCWFRENLNVGTRINISGNQTNNSVIEKYCYGNLESNCDIYGGLYQWDEVMNYTSSSNSVPSGRQGICPAGWHIPSDNEWCQMETYLESTLNCSGTGPRGTFAGGMLKEESTLHWIDPNTGATNSARFNALPGGSTGASIGSTAFFWSSTEYSSPALSWHRSLYNYYTKIYRDGEIKTYGLSVRCVKD